MTPPTRAGGKPMNNAFPCSVHKIYPVVQTPAPLQFLSHILETPLITISISDNTELRGDPHLSGSNLPEISTSERVRTREITSLWKREINEEIERDIKRERVKETYIERGLNGLTGRGLGYKAVGNFQRIFMHPQVILQENKMDEELAKN